MQGRQYTQKPLFVDGDLEKFVPKNHLLRKVNKLINLGFIYDLTQPYYAGKGRPSLDPVVFFKMQLISYLFGISSDRRLCDEIQCNIAYRWYLGYPLDQSTPTHSTLTRVRDRLGLKVYKEVFDKIVKDCQDAGLIEGHQIITDHT
ncbi:MAG: transposase [Candidatus Electrothrix sp. AX1]|nr:transposase [Candidatus Electrothrix sp. AX1]